MVDQSDALKIAHDYLHAVRAMGVNIRHAYLFGSYAQNRQHEWSDIDIALVADDFTGLSFLDLDPFRFLHIQKKFLAIETHTFPTKEFDEGNPFIREIVKTGIEIN